MKELQAKIRGGDKWVTLPSIDAYAELDARKREMLSHGFKVRLTSIGTAEVINPHTKQVEVEYRVAYAEVHEGVQREDKSK